MRVFIVFFLICLWHHEHYIYNHKHANFLDNWAPFRNNSFLSYRSHVVSVSIKTPNESLDRTWSWTCTFHEDVDNFLPKSKSKIPKSWTLRVQVVLVTWQIIDFQNNTSILLLLVVRSCLLLASFPQWPLHPAVQILVTSSSYEIDEHPSNAQN